MGPHALPTSLSMILQGRYHILKEPHKIDILDVARARVGINYSWWPYEKRCIFARANLKKSQKQSQTYQLLNVIPY